MSTHHFEEMMGSFTMRWFGQSWDAPINETCPQCPVPVGQECIWCYEKVGPEDSGIVYSNGPVSHWECFMRQTVGSIAHQQKLCLCYGGNAVEWPGDLSRREAALAAVRFAHITWPGGVAR